MNVTITNAVETNELVHFLTSFHNFWPNVADTAYPTQNTLAS
jgi:hypothetical protein